MSQEPPLIQNAELPYLSAALICETALNEKSGVVSLIRLIDTMSMTIHAQPRREDEQERVNAITLKFNVFLSFRGGPARGKREAVLEFYHPNGNQVLRGGPYPMVFTSDEQGQNVNIELSVVLKDAGLYWFNVVMQDRVLSRMPLIVNISIQPQPPALDTTEPENSNAAE